MADPTHLFGKHLGSMAVDRLEDQWLTRIVQNQLEDLYMLSDEWCSSMCLLADIAELLRRATKLLTQLAKRLATGPHVETYAKLRFKEMNKETDFSDLRDLDYLTAQQDRLR